MTEPTVADTASDRLEDIDDFFSNVEIPQDLYWFVRKENVERCARREDREVIYLERNGRIIGACMVWLESKILAEDEACLRNIAVSAGERRCGYGTELLNEAVDIAEARGKDRMVTDVVAGANSHGWFGRNDFYPDDSYFTAKGNRMVVYARDLEPDFTVEDPLDF